MACCHVPPVTCLLCCWPAVTELLLIPHPRQLMPLLWQQLTVLLPAAGEVMHAAQHCFCLLQVVCTSTCPACCPARCMGLPLLLCRWLGPIAEPRCCLAANCRARCPALLTAAGVPATTREADASCSICWRCSAACYSCDLSRSAAASPQPASPASCLLLLLAQ
jgi:hypothetical protein